MKKKFIYIGITISTLVAALFLFIPGRKPATVAKEAVGTADKPAELLYNKAERLVKNGELLEARKAYNSLLPSYPDSDLTKGARKKLDELNIRILFSPIPEEGSVFYEVKPGDTLTKIANEFNTTVELIMKSNNLTDSIIRPGMKLKVSTAKYSILVDKSQNILMLKANDEILKIYEVSTGANNQTPAGTHKIKNKLIDPTWYKAGAVVPPESPDNILGTRWLGLTADTYGIHGTTDESSIGRHITAGCVRMRNADVEELYSIVPVGTEVAIID